MTQTDPGLGEYSAFVRSHPGGHFLQDPAWARVKPQWQWAGIAVRDDSGQLTAAMSLLIRPLPLGFCLAYAPRGPVCDREDAAALGALRSGLRAFARERRCLLTYLDPDEPEENTDFCARMETLGFRRRQSDDFGGIQPHSVFRLSLEGKDEAALLAAFAPKTRYNIRLSLRRGVTVADYSGDGAIPEAALDSFSRLMDTTGRRDGFRVRGRSYFAALLQALGESATLHLAFLEDCPIAGTISVCYGGRAWYLYGASANEHRGAMPNYLLQWHMLCRAKRRGCRLYDFRGVPGTGRPDDPLYGLYRFKKGFGGTHTRFAGLFTLYHRPLLGRLFDLAQSTFRRLRLRKTRKKNTQ